MTSYLKSTELFGLVCIVANAMSKYKQIIKPFLKIIVSKRLNKIEQKYLQDKNSIWGVPARTYGLITQMINN